MILKIVEPYNNNLVHNYIYNASVNARLHSS